MENPKCIQGRPLSIMPEKQGLANENHKPNTKLRPPEKGFMIFCTFFFINYSLFYTTNKRFISKPIKKNIL